MLNYQRVTLVCSPQLGPLNPRGPGGSLDPVLSHWQHALPQAWLCSGSQVPSWEQRHNSVAQKLITYLSTWIYGSTICKLFKYFKSTALQSERGVKVLMLEWIETNSDQVINHYIPWHCVPNTFWLIQYFRELYKVGPPSYKLVHKPRSSRSPIPHQPKNPNTLTPLTKPWTRKTSLFSGHFTTIKSEICWFGSVSKPCTPVVHIKIAGKWMFIP